MPTLSERLAFATNSLYPRVTHRAGTAVATTPPVGVLDGLAGHRYCVVVSYRRTGEPVATPLWFGIDGSRLFFRSLRGSAKLGRIRRNSRVLVAPCSVRGRPLGPPFEGRARILPETASAAAERAIQANYGIIRRVYEWVIRDAEARYVEVTPVVHSRTGR
jgi:uncharacterized protein